MTNKTLQKIKDSSFLQDWSTHRDDALFYKEYVGVNYTSKDSFELKSVFDRELQVINAVDTYDDLYQPLMRFLSQYDLSRTGFRAFTAKKHHRDKPDYYYIELENQRLTLPLDAAIIITKTDDINSLESTYLFEYLHWLEDPDSNNIAALTRSKIFTISDMQTKHANPSEEFVEFMTKTIWKATQEEGTMTKFTLKQIIDLFPGYLVYTFDDGLRITKPGRENPFYAISEGVFEMGSAAFELTEEGKLELAKRGIEVT